MVPGTKFDYFSVKVYTPSQSPGGGFARKARQRSRYFWAGPSPALIDNTSRKPSPACFQVRFSKQFNMRHFGSTIHKETGFVDSHYLIGYTLFMVNVGQIHYYVICIGEFARAKHMSVKDAFNYLHAHKGVEFLVECYDAEHTLSLENAVEDLTHVCRSNGGNID
jgi:hypothetical protein